MSRRAFLGAGVGAVVGSGVGARALGRRDARSLVARPVPSAAQLAWQRDELALFAHFTVNTYTDREWGDGTESPLLFAPSRFDADTWARTAQSTGFRSIVLTAKHHDGFCLWPSRVTKHSVASSGWRDGTGDVVRDVAQACHTHGLGLGLYLSPWDRHEPSYGSGAGYMDFYCAQLEELLSQYGRVREVWFDGANGEGPNGKRQRYDWPRIHALVRRLQPNAVMFSDAGPDVRWIGNESGVAGETCWSTIDPASVPYAGYDAPNVGELLQRGDPQGSVWRPGETDVSIRPGWFWHAAEDTKVRSSENLLSLYETSVGRNSKLLLNVPPTREGLFHSIDVRSLEGFAARRVSLFARDLAAGSSVAAPGAGASRVVDGDIDSHWTAPESTPSATLDLRMRRVVRCNVMRLQEPIALGQVVERYELAAEVDGAWRVIARGTTVGYCRLVRFEPVDCRRLRLTLQSSLGTLRLSTLSLYMDVASPR